MTTPKTKAERLIAFMHCAHSGQHDFSKGDICENCGAHKGDANLLDVIRHAKVKKENPYAQ